MGERRNPHGYVDRFWWSRDGLRLHCRDYGGAAAANDLRPAILCLPGLTRNARDFEGVAERLSPDWRVIALDLRGRGESAYAKDSMSYVPLTYIQDIEALIDELRLDRFVFFGTSLGGILSMLLGANEKKRLAGVLLNDVGPKLETSGLSRIRDYVGKGTSCPTWIHAARTIADASRDIYPDYAIEDWLRMAKRLYRVTPPGRVTLDYDMRIAEPFRLPGNEAGPDMWRAYDALAGVPMLVVRGERSDILSAETAEAMAARSQSVELVTVPRTGHAPTLEEPEAVAGIDRLLARIETHAAERAG